MLIYSPAPLPRPRAPAIMQVVVRGVLANWLVCLAVWQATAAQSVGGRLVGIIGAWSRLLLCTCGVSPVFSGRLRS